MNILCCFKIVPDLDMLSEQDWIADSDHNVDVSFAKTLWNCFDESALEMMLKLSDLSESFNVFHELNALTIGNSQCDSYIKTLYALGYKKAVRIESEKDLRFSPELTARVITEYVRKMGGQDVIVMGMQSSVGDNGKTPLVTAEYLHWPCISQVINVESVDEQHLKVRSMVDNGILTQVIKVPCVLSVGNTPNSYLRVPTLRDRMKLGKQSIEVISLEDVVGNQSYEDLKTVSKVVKLSRIDNSRMGEIITGESPKEKASKLYHTYLKGRLEKL